MVDNVTSVQGKDSAEKVYLADANQTLMKITAWVIMAIAVSLSLYQLYTAGVAALTAMVQRSIHLGAILSLTFLLRPAFSKQRKDKFSFFLFLDWILVALSIYCIFYIGNNLTAIFERQGDWLLQDKVVSIIGTLLVLEACRRVIGLVMTGICATSIAYAFFGPYMPELIIHKGYSIERIATTLWLTTEGIFGLPIGVAATFVFVFVLFGAILETTGGGAFFIDMAYALTGLVVIGMTIFTSGAAMILNFSPLFANFLLGVCLDQALIRGNPCPGGVLRGAQGLVNTQCLGLIVCSQRVRTQKQGVITINSECP